MTPLILQYFSLFWNTFQRDILKLQNQEKIIFWITFTQVMKQVWDKIFANKPPKTSQIEMHPYRCAICNDDMVGFAHGGPYAHMNECHKYILRINSPPGHLQRCKSLLCIPNFLYDLHIVNTFQVHCLRNMHILIRNSWSAVYLYGGW